MDFLSTQEKAQLQKFLVNNTLLRTADENFRGVLLANSGLDKYRSRIALNRSLQEFVLSLCAILSENRNEVDSSAKLPLIVFLEYISESDDNLSTQDQEFIQKVIIKWEQSKKRPVSRIPPQPPKSTSSPPQNKLKETTPRTAPPVKNNNRDNTPRQTRRPVSTVNYAIAIGTQTWFILLPIVVIWFYIGASSQSFIDSTNSNQKVILLVVFGSLGGLFSGLGGWLAWWRVTVVRRPIQWEQALLCSAIGLACGGGCWASIGYVLSNGGNLRNYGEFVGLFFGLTVVVAIFGWLSLRRTRA
ncbi:hypothetical protein NIES4103_45250 [Nostoc sp. NIES-4103]|nr:hypothetical protein NIES4103_45250 [Nostoc sp. NIES-4103]